jgi:copper chaperone
VKLPTRNVESKLIDMVKTSIKVAGMTCQHCVNSVTEEVSGLSGVVSVKIDLASGNVEIESANELVVSDLEAAIQEAGYEVVSE